MAVRTGDGYGRALVAALLRALVVLGLVAMHQLGGGPHTAHAAPAPAGPGHASPAHGHAAPASAAPGHAPARHLAPPVPHHAAASWSPATPDDPPALLCLAVLLAGLLLTLSGAGRRTTAARRCPPGGPPATAPLGRGPPRLLLARLCVLRV